MVVHLVAIGYTLPEGKALGLLVELVFNTAFGLKAQD
jgi:hypothetical protein